MRPLPIDVEHSLNLTLRHVDEEGEPWDPSGELLRREWDCLATNKTADPTILTVHLFFRIRF